MSNQSTNDEDQKQQSITKQRPIRPELLTKIYYPDSYTCFTDREPSQVRSSNEQQYPTSNLTRPLVHTATVRKQMLNEIEMIERQNKNSVRIVCI